MVDFLVEEGHSLRIQLRYSLGDALKIAAQRGDPTTLDKLLETGVHPDASRDESTGVSAFTIASQHWGTSGSTGHFQVHIDSSVLHYFQPSTRVETSEGFGVSRC